MQSIALGNEKYGLLQECGGEEYGEDRILQLLPTQSVKWRLSRIRSDSPPEQIRWNLRTICY